MTKHGPTWEPKAKDYQQVFNEQSPWSTSGIVPDEFAREVERPLAKHLWRLLVDGPVRRFQVVLGPRRVGKSTSMYQTVRRLLRESTVGTHFHQMMETVLNIVKTATTDKEVQKAEIIAKNMDGQAQIQAKLFGILENILNSGDKDKADTFVKIFQSITKLNQGKPGQEGSAPLIQ